MDRDEHFMRAVRVEKKDLAVGEFIAAEGEVNNHGVRTVLWGQVAATGTSIKVINAVEKRLQFNETLKTTVIEVGLYQFPQGWRIYRLPKEGEVL